MADEPELPFEGLDAERSLPPELRARLEAALLAAVAGGLPVPADARGLHQAPGTHTESLDAPRPLPEPLRSRLESALLAEAASTSAATSPSGAGPAPTPELVGAGAAATSPPGAGSPPTPSSSRATVTSLAERRRRKVVAAWSSVAAVLLLVVAVAGLAGRGGNTRSGSLEAAGPTTTLQTPASIPSDAGVPGEAAPADQGSPDGAASAGSQATATTRTARRPAPSTTAPHVPSGGGQPATVSAPTSPTSPTPSPPGGGSSQPASDTGGQGPPPPFYNATSPNGDSTSSAPAMTGAAPAPNSPGGSEGAAPPQNQKSATPAPAGPPLRVGVFGGDAAQEAGFRAYVDRVNQSGGVRGHSIELVPVGPTSPRSDTIATVNLSPQPVAGPGGAPGWATGPLLETLTTPESLLTGNGAVFSFASPPERQGHLAADAVFPSPAPDGTKAVIYVPSAAGPLRDVVPEAIKAVLKQRNVTAQIVTYDPNPSVRKPLIPADAAFVSLDPAAARAWAAQAKADGYRPAGGIAGIYSLADDTVLPDLPEGARVVSPYVTPGGDEGQAIRSGAGGTSASVLHGWATAKSLAAAIWRTGADTPAELQGALEGLQGWSSGLAPAYETRPGTRSRTPEGVLFQVQSGAFKQQGAFLRDPRPQPV